MHVRMACCASGLTSAWKKEHSPVSPQVRHRRGNGPSVGTLSGEGEGEEATREAVRGHHVCVCVWSVSPVEMSALRRVLRAQEVPAKATRLVIDQHMAWGDLTPPAASNCRLPPSGRKALRRPGGCGLFFSTESALSKQNLDASGDRKLENDGQA